MFALGGLAAGTLLTYPLARPDLGRLAWYATLILGGAPLVYHTFQKLSARQFSADVIATLAILGAIALDQSFAGVIIVLMQSGGEALDGYAFHRASSSLRELLQREPRTARRRRADRVEEIPVEEVRVGDRLLVRSGDVLPVDGEVEGEGALLDEAAISGEPLPKKRDPGTLVLSGSANVGGPFGLIARRTSRESQYARMVDLVRSAQDRKPRIQRLADRYAAWFTPLTLLVGALGWYFTASPTTALAVLVVATPCPLIIATPIAVIGAVNQAARRGIVVKSGGALEEVGNARVVAFDKTGTITSGRPEVERVVVFDPSGSPADLLRLTAALEQNSSHPLASAVLRAAPRGEGLPPATQVHERAGSGLGGFVEGHAVEVGSETYLRGLGFSDLSTRLEQLVPPGELRGRLSSFVAVDGRPIGAILYADRIRPGILQLSSRLRDLGVQHVVLLSGDSQANVETIARQARIWEFHGELLPEQKLARIQEYRKEKGTTVMVGDGINDAAALASASVGIALGAQGAGITAEAADAVLLEDDPARVADLIDLGKRMNRVAREGIFAGLGASLVLMGIAAFGGIIPAEGALLQEVIDLLVIVNALRMSIG